MSANVRLEMPAVARFKVAGSMIRTNLPTVQVDHTVDPADRGAIIGTAGITVTLPPYNDQMQGEDYLVPNHSNGISHVTPSANADGTPGKIKSPLNGALVDIFPVDAGEALTLTIETDGLTWIVI